MSISSNHSNRRMPSTKYTSNAIFKSTCTSTSITSSNDGNGKRNGKGNSFINLSK